jgi:hypothetical protein
MHQASELTRILSEMGKAADDIANTLRTAGIQGVRNTVRFLNPIVRYCQSLLLLDIYSLDIMQTGVLRIQMPDKVTQEFALPVPVTEFLHDFDNGAYPDLELPTPTSP